MPLWGEFGGWMWEVWSTMFGIVRAFVPTCSEASFYTKHFWESAPRRLLTPFYSRFLDRARRTEQGEQVEHIT